MLPFLEWQRCGSITIYINDILISAICGVSRHNLQRTINDEQAQPPSPVAKSPIQTKHQAAPSYKAHEACRFGQTKATIPTCMAPGQPALLRSLQPFISLPTALNATRGRPCASILQLSLSHVCVLPVAHPTEPSNFRLMSALTSSANSSGSLLNTSAQNPDMMVATASSAPMPLCWK